MSYYEFIQPFFIALKSKVMLSFSCVSYFFKKLIHVQNAFLTPRVAKQPASVLIITEITSPFFALDF